ncbi:unnamed protein product, partial [Medioppia subpectinata]
IPNLNETSQEAVLVFAGEEAFVDCKVENLQNYTILFKFMVAGTEPQKSEIISAGNLIITSDPRFSMLHHSEHDVWVLNIKNTKTTDSGIYVCETNSTPKQQIARLLSVIDTDSSDSNDKTDAILSDVNHNYTECCIEE